MNLSDACRAYLREHGIDELIVAKLRVTERDGRLQYPNGRSVALNGTGRKAIQPRGRPLELWWPLGAPADRQTVLVCEGESDALAALSAILLSEFQHAGPRHPLAGVAVAAMPGTGYPAARLADDLRGVGVAIVAFDGDDAGHKATETAAAALHATGIACHDLAVPDGRDLADCLGQLHPNLRVAWLADRLSDARPVEVVANSDVEANVATTPVADRYAGRRVDLAALLAKPPQPIPWRVHDVVADGTLTIISGESGSGKSWLVQGLCTGVARGHAVAGMLCRKGGALYVDGEMGPAMFVDQRLRPAGVTVPEFDYIDAMGLDVSKPDDLAWLHEQIVETGAKLVVIDSLRRLTPSKAENDSDDMAPTIAALAKLARDTWTAIVLIHHKGDSEKFSRGSSAIRDQADALFGLLREDDGDARRLTCRSRHAKPPRYSVEPPDVLVRIAPESGGVEVADVPEEDSTPATLESLIALSLPAQTKTEAARKAGRRLDDRGFREAWAALEARREIEHNALTGKWELAPSHPFTELDRAAFPERVVATETLKARDGHHPPLRLVEGAGETDPETAS